MLASWWHSDSSWSSRAMSCQTISPLVILWNSICPSKSKLKWVSWIGRTIPCYTCLFFSNSVPSSSSFKRYSNRKVCCWSSCDSNIDWYLCLSSLWFYSFADFAIIISIGKMDCLESCVTELRLIKPYHIWLLRTVAPPWSRGSSCGCFFWSFSIFPPQEHLALTSLHHRLKEK